MKPFPLGGTIFDPDGVITAFARAATVALARDRGRPGSGARLPG